MYSIGTRYPAYIPHTGLRIRGSIHSRRWAQKLGLKLCCSSPLECGDAYRARPIFFAACARCVSLGHSLVPPACPVVHRLLLIGRKKKTSRVRGHVSTTESNTGEADSKVAINHCANNNLHERVRMPAMSDANANPSTSFGRNSLCYDAAAARKFEGLGQPEYQGSRRRICRQVHPCTGWCVRAPLHGTTSLPDLKWSGV